MCEEPTVGGYIDFRTKLIISGIILVFFIILLWITDYYSFLRYIVEHPNEFKEVLFPTEL